MSHLREPDVRPELRPGGGTGAELADRVDAFFGRLGERGRVIVRQLPLSVTVVLVVAAAKVFHPETLADPRFQLALLAHTALFVLSVAVPWGRLPRGAYAVIPALDCVAVGFTREAGGPNFNVLSLLLVFPVIWLSVDRNRAGVVLAVAGATLSTVLPAAAFGAAPTQGSMIRTIFLPLVMAAIAVTAHVVAGALYRQRQTLVRKDEALADTVAESMQRQRLLDAVLSTVNVGVWVVDQNGQDVLTNKALRTDAALSGLAPSANRPRLFQADRATALPPERFPTARAAAGETFTDELCWAGEGEDMRAYSVTARTMVSTNGTHAGAVITFAEVTALIRALSAKDNFVATVSHELRTPLTSILGYLELVLDEPGHEDIEEELRIVQRNANHLLGLVNDLIAVASERVELALQEADVASLLAGVVASSHAKATVSGVELVLDLEEPLNARVDPGRISQVFGNLVSNAIKFSPDGGRVTARAHRANSHVVCSITDTGIGMDGQEQEQAFTKFFRSARSRETAIPGAGLGLPISKTIVEGHGGSISLSSVPGKGTTVTVSLPVS
ncbi:HAMP domain-containing histidine kinase [Arthrobacter sp. FW305-BF8]|uniref:sensor histidine kinase n=1 Tax=Arthrobacter sp. FW305-BF8 TaxID=2879617 RepID=UPI001F166017|nr:HAMP domain-containing sensor histidine kinase [Arthrobacter sp. FW305-BF8]UKA54688.1 HAMP domain-containing histidine kinase [Arthrobacter sp. FW305-BF8]